MLAAKMAERGRGLGSQAQRFIVRLRDFFVAEKEHGGPFLPVSDVLGRLHAALQVSVFQLYHSKQVRKTPKARTLYVTEKVDLQI